jgi:hypothetical protein
MINFRYHVVSLTAVFLALAVGLVLGSTVLNGPTLDALESQVNTLGRDNQQLRDQVGFLQDEISREEDFASEAAPMLLAGELTGQRAALLVLPGGEDYAEGMASTLETAGATVTGTVVIRDKFTHPQNRRTGLLDLAHEALPPSVDAELLPANSDGVETSAALLAAVLFDPAAPGPPGSQTSEPAAGEPVEPVPEEDRTAVLSAYTTAEYLAETEQPTQPSDVVIVVAGLPVSDSDPDERNQALITTVEQFALYGPVVVAGNGVAGDGNLVAAVRGDPELSQTISTVDNSSTPQGQIAAGLATARHLAGAVGHFGNGEGAERLLPEPAAS